jgi:hypothetical protein
LALSISSKRYGGNFFNLSACSIFISVPFPEVLLRICYTR